eukprot:gene12625-7442_t
MIWGDPKGLRLSTRDCSCEACTGETYQPDNGSTDEVCQAQTECGPGEKINGPSITIARECSTCPPSTYQDETDHREQNCKMQRVCARGFMFSVNNDSTEDGTCSLCAEGTYQEVPNARIPGCKQQRMCNKGQRFDEKAGYGPRQWAGQCIDCDRGTFIDQSTHRNDTCYKLLNITTRQFACQQENVGLSYIETWRTEYGPECTVKQNECVFFKTGGSDTCNDLCARFGATCVGGHHQAGCPLTLEDCQYSEDQHGALHTDGSVTSWGLGDSGGSGAPTDKGYVTIYSGGVTFAAMKADGSVFSWGNGDGGSGAPTGKGFVAVYSTYLAFAARKADGSLFAWGYSGYGGSGAPTEKGFVAVYAAYHAFAARKADGSLVAWGLSGYGGSGAPTDKGFVAVYSTYRAFTAVKSDGSLVAWGHSSYGGSGAPADAGYIAGYIAIHATGSAFAAMKAGGALYAWGNSVFGATGAPASLPADSTFAGPSFD